METLNEAREQTNMIMDHDVVGTEAYKKLNPDKAAKYSAKKSKKDAVSLFITFYNFKKI